MARRAQPNRLSWPITPEQWKRADEMFQTLFDDSNNGTMSVRATQLKGVLPASLGGTGFGSFVIGDILFADSTTTLARLADVVTGNVLLSGGVGAAPSWGKVNLSTAVTSSLPATNGGTGLTSYTIGDLLYANSTSTLTKLLDVAAGSYLRSGGVATAPLWSTLTLPNAAAQGDLFVSNATNVMTVLNKNTTATRYLSNTGASNNPAWAQVDLSNGTVGIPQDLLVQAANETLTAGYGAVVPRRRKINSGIKLSLLSGSIFRIV